jgi:hypothetical protein
VHGPKLNAIERFLRRTEKQTGLSKPLLLIHVLTPYEPPLPRWRLREHVRLGPAAERFRTWIIEITTPDITWRDFENVFHALGATRGTRGEFLDETDHMVIQAARELGPPPPPGQGRTQHWQALRDICEERGVKTFGTAAAAKRRLERVQKKIRRSGLE